MARRYGYAFGWLALASLIVLLAFGFVSNPVKAKRAHLERQLAEAAPSDIGIDFAQDAQFDAWQQGISARTKLWSPLVPPPKVDAPPPELQKMLAGVEPTRTATGSGEGMKIKISVDGKKDWYAKGATIKECTITEITDADVLFTIVRDGVTHGIRLPRK